MTYLIHGSFNIEETNLTEYETKITNLCSEYNGTNIYLSYGDLNGLEMYEYNTRSYTKTKPVLKGILEVQFTTLNGMPSNNELQQFTTIDNIKKTTHRTYKSDGSDVSYESEAIPIDALCKCIKQLQRIKVKIDIIFNENSMQTIYQSLQIRKMSDGDDKPKSKNKSKIPQSHSVKHRSYTESDFLLLGTIPTKTYIITKESITK